MTREEALESYEKLYDYMVGDNDAVKLEYGEFMELSHYIRAALRGPTREMVERVWFKEPYTRLGAWNRDDGATVYSAKNTCMSCGCETPIGNFCHNCGAALTDEAVDMVMERMEALEDGKTDRT